MRVDSPAFEDANDMTAGIADRMAATPLCNLTIATGD